MKNQCFKCEICWENICTGGEFLKRMTNQEQKLQSVERRVGGDKG